MKKTIGVVLFILLIGISPHPRSDAQEGGEQTCPLLVQTAYETTQAACDGTGRNQACYGNINVEAEAQVDTEALEFEAPGDTVDLAALASLHLSSMDTTAATWGISLMRVQAGLPEDDTSQNVELLLFGNVDIENATPEANTPVPILVEITPAASNNINIRSEPSTSGGIVGTLAPGEIAQANGRNAAGDWLQIQLPDDATAVGWVSAPLVSASGDITSLSIVDGAAPVETTPASPPSPYGPMQAFYFQSGVNDRPCAEAPDSGLLIQTPEGAGEITFLVNEVTIDLGSTAYLQAQPSSDMLINVVEGQAQVTVQNITVTAPAGTRVRVPLDANGLASGTPIGPEPYDASALQVLPVTLLNQPIAIAPALTEDEITALGDSLVPTSGTWLSTGITVVDCQGTDLTPIWTTSPFGELAHFSISPDGSFQLASFGLVPNVGAGIYETSVSPSVYAPLIAASSDTYTVRVSSPEQLTLEILSSDGSCFIRYTETWALNAADDVTTQVTGAVPLAGDWTATANVAIFNCAAQGVSSPIDGFISQIPFHFSVDPDGSQISTNFFSLGNFSLVSPGLYEGSGNGQLAGSWTVTVLAPERISVEASIPDGDCVITYSDEWTLVEAD